MLARPQYTSDEKRTRTQIGLWGVGAGLTLLALSPLIANLVPTTEHVQEVVGLPQDAQIWCQSLDLQENDTVHLHIQLVRLTNRSVELFIAGPKYEPPPKDSTTLASWSLPDDKSETPWQLEDSHQAHTDGLYGLCAKVPKGYQTTFIAISLLVDQPGLQDDIARDFGWSPGVLLLAVASILLLYFRVYAKTG